MWFERESTSSYIPNNSNQLQLPLTETTFHRYSIQIFHRQNHISNIAVTNTKFFYFAISQRKFSKQFSSFADPFVPSCMMIITHRTGATTINFCQSPSESQPNFAEIQRLHMCNPLCVWWCLITRVESRLMREDTHTFNYSPPFSLVGGNQLYLVGSTVTCFCGTFENVSTHHWRLIHLLHFIDVWENVGCAKTSSKSHFLFIVGGGVQSIHFQTQSNPP